MTKRTKIIISVAVVIIAAAGTAAGYFYSKNHAHKAQVPQESLIGKRVDTTGGQLAEGFPTNLITDAGAVIGESYTIQEKTGMQTDTVFTTMLSFDDVYAYYKNLFTVGKYKISQDEKNESAKVSKLTAVSADGQQQVMVGIVINKGAPSVFVINFEQSPLQQGKEK